MTVVSIWLSVRLKFINKRRWSKREYSVSNRGKEWSTTWILFGLKNWKSWNNRVWVQPSSKPLLQHTRCVFQMDLSQLPYRKQALLPHCSTSHLRGSQWDCYTALIKLLQVWRKLFNKLNFLNKSSVNRGWMNGCMHNVPDTGNGNVLSCFFCFFSSSNFTATANLRLHGSHN